MISIRAFHTPAALVFAALALTACGSDKSNKAVNADSTTMADAAQTWKLRKSKADSVLKTAPKMSEVVKELGSARYDEADATLTAAVLKEAEKTRDCYTNVLRDNDPGLAAVFYVLVNFGGAGWDIVRIEKWSYTSVWGGAVYSCINLRAPKEWKLPTKGVKYGAHLVKLVYTPDSVQAK